MPHGGYHGTVIMGGNVIQQGGTGPNAGKPPPKTKKPENVDKAIKDKTNEIKNILEKNKGDNKGGYIAIQAAANQLDKLYKQQQEETLKSGVTSDFSKGIVNKSNFTGDAGDKDFLGINLGSTPTVAKTTINPFTGKKITTSKVREGMTSPEYGQYMSGLYNLNPNLMRETFPLASGKVVQPVLAQIYNAIKNKSGAFKGITGLDEAKNVSPDIKTAYGNYIDQMNSQINNIIEGDKTPIDPGLINALPKNEKDFVSDKDYLLPGAMEEAILAGEEPYNPAMAEDKESQEEIERSLLNQYSLLGKDDLASSLVDETQETDLEESINPDVDATAAYEQEFLDTYGVPMMGNVEIPMVSDPGSTLYGMGDRFTKEKFAMDNNIPLDQIGEFYPKVTTYPYSTSEGVGEITADDTPGDFDLIDYARPIFGLEGTQGFSESISDTPKLGDEIKSVDFSNLGYKDGGSVYNVLKLINDTMNDG